MESINEILNKSHDLRKIAADDTLWLMVAYLARSDYRINELAGILYTSAETISKKLKILEEMDLISSRQDNSNRNDPYYKVETTSLRNKFIAAGESLHPGLIDELRTTLMGTRLIPSQKPKILFICTHNSARSIMAEAITRKLSDGKVDVYSAGTIKTKVNSLAIQTLQKMGIDTNGLESKSLDELKVKDFDYIITVCDQAKEACPAFSSNITQMHWSFEDPAAREGSESEKLDFFLKTATELQTRIRYLLSLIDRKFEP